MNGNVIRTITIRGTSEGLDKLQTDLVKLAAAHKNVAIAAEETDKKTLSLEQAWKRQTLKLDEAARAQNNIARETKTANQMLHEQRITTEQHAERLNLINQHYTKATQGAQTYGKALQQGTGEARLARHELINLSRQIQDVGVGIVSGQSPFTILVQQGAQIADVFATSSGTLRGFFAQAVAGAGRFLGSTAAIAGGVATLGASIVYAAASYTSGQKEIEKALSGIGRASGVTRDQINEIAEASSSAFGLSTSEARTAASAFAATGKIYKDNVGTATKLVDDYARAGGDAAEVTKMLGAAMADPAAGALEMNKALGFLDATTLNHIRSLQSMGQLQQAQAVLMEAAGPAIRKAAEATGFWTKAWNLATNSAAEYFETLGKGALRGVEGVTGIRTGGYSQAEEYNRARQRLAEKQASPFQGALAQPGIKAAEEEVRRLEKAFIDLGLAQEKARFAQLSLEADAAARSFMPLTAEIEKATQALNTLIDARLRSGGEVSGAEKVGNVRLVQLQQEEAALVRQAQATSEIALMYPGMSVEVAKQLYALQQQLTVAQARTGAEQIVAQQVTTQNTLYAAGKLTVEQLGVAAAQRAIAEANVNKGVEDQIKSLKDQVKLIQAGVEGNTAQVKAQQAYTKAIESGANPALAAHLATLTQAVTEEQEWAAIVAERIANEERAAQAEQQMADARRQANNEAIDAINAQNAYLQQQLEIYNEIEAAIGFSAARQADFDPATGRITITRFGSSQYWTKDGQDTQFNPAGYQSGGAMDISAQLGSTQSGGFDYAAWQTQQAKEAQQQEAIYGPGGFTASEFQAGKPTTWTPTEAGLTFALTKTIEGILGRSGSISEAFNTALASGVTGNQLTQQLIELAPKDQQASMIGAAIEAVSRQPATLAREQLLKQLTDKMEGLTTSTDALNATMQNALSPYYSQDPRTTKLGFRAGVVGNPDWLTGATNATALDAILGPGATAPGMAGGGSFVVGGGYSSIDNKIARFPVASGEQVVVNRRPGGQATVVNNDNRIVINGNVDQDTLSKMKVSRFQQAQRMRSASAA